MPQEPIQVECATHGQRRATFLCRHLLEGEGLGFHQGVDPEDPDDGWPDAWCDACDERVEAAGEWTESAMAAASIQLVCDICYEKIREKNWVQDDAAFERLLEDSVADLEIRQEDIWARFQLDEHESFHWDQESGELVFSQDGRPRVIADVQFVGTISTRSNTWLWAWANASLTDLVKTRVREVRDYGVQAGFLKLAAARWSAEEVDGWEMTAIAARLLGALGAYRSPGENGFTFMVMTAVRWAGEPRLDVQ